MTSTYRTRRNIGFTIVEIMTVVTIIGILAGIAVPNVVRAVNRARKKTAQADIERLASAIESLAWDTGKWPTTSQAKLDSKTIANKPGDWNYEVDDLSTALAGLLDGEAEFGVNWKGPYISRLEKDPWGNDYWFDPDYYPEGQGWGNKPAVPAVGSSGPDGRGPVSSPMTYAGDDMYIILGGTSGGCSRVSSYGFLD